MTMHVSTLLARKSTGVITVRPDADLATAARLMADHNVGALVVSKDGRTVDGIISERDLVRRSLATGAEAGPTSPVAAVMTRDVTTCDMSTSIDQLMVVMTDERIRHVPVIQEETLAGIVSIGDVVAFRVAELEVQTEALEHYITGSA